MITGPPPKFHVFRDILGADLAALYRHIHDN